MWRDPQKWGSGVVTIPLVRARPPDSKVLFIVGDFIDGSAEMIKCQICHRPRLSEFFLENELKVFWETPGRSNLHTRIEHHGPDRAVQCIASVAFFSLQLGDFRFSVA
jgi:hypothetical protein